MSGNRLAQLTPDQQASKAAFRALVAAFGGQAAAAAETGKSQSRISTYCNINTDEFAPQDAVDQLEELTRGTPGHPHVTRWRARRLGFALVRLPDAPDGATDWHQAIGGLAKEVGEVIERVCGMLADGKVTAGEVRDGRVRTEIAEAQEKLAQLDALCAAAAEG